MVVVVALVVAIGIAMQRNKVLRSHYVGGPDSFMLFFFSLFFRCRFAARFFLLSFDCVRVSPLQKSLNECEFVGGCNLVICVIEQFNKRVNNRLVNL